MRSSHLSTVADCGRGSRVRGGARRDRAGRRPERGRPSRVAGDASVVDGVGSEGRERAVGSARSCKGLAGPAERGAARRAGAGRQRSVELAVRPVHLGRPVSGAVRADGGPGGPGHPVAHEGRAERRHRRARTTQFLAVSGSAASVNAAFGTQLGTFVVNGQQTQAPTSDLSVPDALSDIVLAVTGLSTLGHKVKPADFGAPDAFVNGTPCSAFYGQQLAKSLPKFQGKTLPWAVCGYTPDQLRGAYGIDDSGGNGSFRPEGWRNAGRGATVAITDAYDAPTLLQDANTYSTRHGDRPFAHGQFVDKSVPEDASTGDDCGGNGWYGEQALDVEAVHGMAQGANVYYYGAASCFDDDLLAALSQVVHDNKASIVTNSWGEPTFFQLDRRVDRPGDRPGRDRRVRVPCSSTAPCRGSASTSRPATTATSSTPGGTRIPTGPTGDPWVTSVGGTSLAIGKNDNRLFETGWGTEKYNLAATARAGRRPFRSCTARAAASARSSSGRSYQRGVVPSNTTGRAVPDVAMDGDPTTGMLIGETQNFSLAEPLRPGRHPLRRVPRRRHEPLVTAVRRRPGRRAVGSRAADRLRQPVHLLRLTAARLLRRDAAGRRGQRPRRLRQRPERRRRDHLLGQDVRPGLVADHRARLGRRHRCRDCHVPLLRRVPRRALGA